jgi:hypothetical protein
MTKTPVSDDVGICSMRSPSPCIFLGHLRWQRYGNSGARLATACRVLVGSGPSSYAPPAGIRILTPFESDVDFLAGIVRQQEGALSGMLHAAESRDPAVEDES